MDFWTIFILSGIILLLLGIYVFRKARYYRRETKALDQEEKKDRKEKNQEINKA